ncbi:tryptophan-rich sensory protein [Patescibacteria group bacterium]|nr:tryptophan-rich sensory protein [Patescibacteria group bacterium]
MKIKIGALLVSIMLPFVVGAIGGGATVSEIGSWYAGINKPGLLPPNGVFGPVWTILYLMMGISFYLVWTKGKSKKMSTMWGLFLGQLGLNLLWSFLFFKWHLLLLASVEIVVLWGVILANILSFRKIDRLASGLLIPYLLWVSFASYLTIGVWWLN